MLKMCFLEELKGSSMCGCVFACLCEGRLFTEFLTTKTAGQVINLQYSLS